VLRRRVDGETGTDPVTGDRRNVDEVTGFLPLHVGQRSGDSVQHALDVDVDHVVPLVDLQSFERRLRHQTGVVDHHVDPTEALHHLLPGPSPGRGWSRR
jgi:hypothetical protein